MLRSNHPLLKPFGLPLMLLQRLARPILVLMFVFFGGTLGYWLIGLIHGREWSLLDCAYMTSITLTTVGFGDHLSADQLAIGKLYTMMLIVAGMGATLYSVSALTAFIIEGHLGRLFKEVKVERVVEQLNNHTIICGCGETGEHVVQEHLVARRPFVIIDKDMEKVFETLGRDDVPVIEGDATREDVLERAGIERARALVTSLTSDKDNLYLVVTSRFMNKGLEIIAKCVEHDSVAKFRAAGATHVVSPTFIGGLRMASHVLRPHVVDFLDGMLREKSTTQVTEARISAKSAFCGKTLGDARLDEQATVVVIGLRRQGDSEFTYSPKNETTLEAGTILVAIGTHDHLRQFKELVS